MYNALSEVFEHMNLFFYEYSWYIYIYSQACPKYLKQQVYNIFAISQGKRKG